MDVETTGLNVASDSILEIGALKVRNGVPADEFSSFVQCHDPVPVEVVKLTGITDEILAAEGRPIEDVMQELIEFIAHDRVICHNARFDIGFLQSAAKKCGINFMRGNRCEDTFVLSRRKIKGIRGFTLVDIAEHFSLDTSGAHRAMKDCYLTHWIYEKLNEKREP